MWIAFKLGWRQLRRRPGRYVLAAFGVILGVALLFGTMTASATVMAQLRAAMYDLGGEVDLAFVSVVPGNELPHTAAEAVTRLDGIAVAAESLNASTAVARADGGKALDAALSGYDLERATQLFGIAVDQGRLPEDGAAEALLSPRTAQRLGVRIGDDLRLPGPGDGQLVRVVGLLDTGRAGLMGSGPVVITSLGTARDLLGLPDATTRIDVRLEQSWQSEPWIAEHRARLPAGVTTQDMSAFVDPFVSFLRTVTWALSLVSIGAAVVSVYLVYLTMARAVQSRTVAYGTYRALGMTRRELQTAVLREAVLLGLVCIPLGLALGGGLAVGLGTILASAADVDTPTLAIPWYAVLAAVVTGLVATVAGAWIPARAAASTDPVTALRGVRAIGGSRLGGWLAAGGGVLLGAGIVAFPADGGPGVSAIGAVAMLAGVATLVLAGLTPLCRLLHRYLPGMTWTMRFAELRLARDGRRAGAVASLLTLILGTVIVVLATTDSFSTAMVTQLERQFGADVQISAKRESAPVIDRTLRSTAGVQAVATSINGNAELVVGGRTESVSVLAVDPPSYFAVTSLPWVDGSDSATPAGLVDGGVVLPASMAERLGVAVGGQATLRTTQSSEPLTVVGTYASLATGPQLVMSRASASTLLGLTGSTQWHIQATADVDASSLRDRLDDELQTQPGVKVTTAAGMMAEGKRQLGAYRMVLLVIVLLIGLVGLVGLWSTVSMMVRDQAHELGVLRAIGVSRGQVRRLVMTEGMMLTGVAVLAAAAAGVPAGVLATLSVGGALGVSLPPSAPWGALVFLVPAMVLVGALVATGPAVRATRIEPADAVREE